MQVVDPVQALAALNEAQKRAAEQRIAAEQLLERARLLEKRLSDEAEQARIASEHAHLVQLRAAVTAAEAAERDATERVKACASALRERANERERAEQAERAARDDVAAADEMLRERRVAREEVEEEARAAQALAKPFDGDTPSLEAIDLLRELEAQMQFTSDAARRIAERRAAD